MTVRAKFKVSSKTTDTTGAATIMLTAVYGDSSENKEFFKYTPAGSISLSVVNPPAAQQFELGAEYYVDFIKAEEAK